MNSFVAAAYAPVDPHGRSARNSTTQSLGAGEEYTGVWELVPYSDVLTRVLADADATQYYEFSFDGVNVDSRFPPNGFEIKANVGEFHRAVKGGAYFRTRIINGDVPMSSLRVSTNYGNFGDGSLPLNATISSDADATVTRSVNSEVDLALGRIGGMTALTKFGRNPGIGSGESQDIWNGGDLYTGQPVSFTPETVTVTSASANDTAVGTGARTIRITGLRSSTSEEYETEDITLNGTSDAISVNSWWRINRAFVLTAGSGGENDGEITIKSTSTTANVFVNMAEGFNQSTISAYTVPYGKTLLLKRIRVSMTRTNGSAGSATVSMRVREVGGVYRAINVYEIQDGGGANYKYFAGATYPAGSDIKFRADDVSDNNTVVEAAFEFILID